jgi:hypothetical protein
MAKRYSLFKISLKKLNTSLKLYLMPTLRFNTLLNSLATCVLTSAYKTQTAKNYSLIDILEQEKNFVQFNSLPIHRLRFNFKRKCKM